MRRSISRLFAGLLATPLLLASSAALADDLSACGNIALLGSGSCELDVTGGCEGKCTAPQLVAACDGQCDVEAGVDCTGGCEATCVETCTADPPSYSCEEYCGTDCDAGCEASCDNSGCQADCHLDCTNRCQVSCTENPPTATCDTKCKASCDASCKVTANIDCHAKCTVDLQGGCKLDCQAPDGALFCDGQYVHVNNLDQCVDQLIAHGLEANVSAKATCDANGCDAAAAVGCSAAPAMPADSGPLGVGAIASMVAGLGLIVSRRRRRG